MQCCWLSRIMRETPDFEPDLPVSRLESKISWIITKVLPFLVDSTLWQWNFKYFAWFELFLLTLNVVGGKLTNQVKIQFKHLFHAVLEKWCHALCIMTSSTNYLNIWRLEGVDSPADAFYACERVEKIQGAKKFINFLQLSIWASWS